MKFNNKFFQIRQQSVLNSRIERLKVLEEAKKAFETLALRKNPIREIEVDYLGSQGEGNITAIRLHPQLEEFGFPEVGEKEREAIEKFAPLFLPSGWKSSEGSKGTMNIDLRPQTWEITFEHYWCGPTLDESIGATSFPDM